MHVMQTHLERVVAAVAEGEARGLGLPVEALRVGPRLAPCFVVVVVVLMVWCRC